MTLTNWIEIVGIIIVIIIAVRFFYEACLSLSWQRRDLGTQAGIFTHK